MNQARIRPPYPIGKAMAGIMALPILISCLFMSTIGFGEPQHTFWKDYLKISYTPHIDKHSFGRQGAGVDIPKVQREVFREQLRTKVYGGQTPWEIMRVWLGVFVVAWVTLFCFAWRVDQHRLIKFRIEPRHLRGTKLVTPDEFRRTVKDPGLGIWIEEPAGWFGGWWLDGWKLKTKRNIKLLQISESVETQHIQTIGDSGSGKTLALLSIMEQAERNGETCVVLDQHLQFLPYFYRPERGDVILNPTDERCAYWDMAGELDYSTATSAQVTAQSQAAGLYPGSDTGSDKNHWFFVNCCRRIWTHCMMTYKCTAQKMAYLMEHIDPIVDAIAKGTDLEEMLKRNAEGQRAAISGTLTGPLFALKQIPPNDGKRPVWSAREWCKHRKGWIFITSSFNTREALAPLQRVWINSIMEMLLDSIGKEQEANMPNVRMILDEIPTVGELGMLPKAYLEARKAGLTLAVGFQGRSGIRAIYGERAEGIFSAAYTQLLLRTRDPEAAKWMSELCGEFEGERLNEHVSPDGKRSYTANRAMERVVLASQLAGLEPRYGYIRNGNYTIPVKVSLAVKRPKLAEPFIPCQGLPPEMLELPALDELRAAEEAERQEVVKAMNETVFDPAVMASAALPVDKRRGRARGKGSNTEQGDLYGTAN
jgi:hypothetical protein